MKRINRKMHLIFLMIIVFIVAASAIDERRDDQRFKQLETELQHRTYLDSIYWQHVSECAFISNDDIRIGYNNYLQVIHVKGKGEIK